MLKTAEPKKGGDEVGDNSRAGRDGIDGSRMDDVEVDGSEVKIDEVGKKGQKTSKSKKSSKSKTVGSDFLTLGAKLAFTKLRQVFLKAPIIHDFNPECYIRIKRDTSGYIIGRVLS